MDLKVFVLVITLCITFTTIQGATPTCCLRTSPIPLAILKIAEKVEYQFRNGICEINAVVLHYNGKKYCAGTKARHILNAIRKKMGSQHFK